MWRVSYQESSLDICIPVWNYLYKEACLVKKVRLAASAVMSRRSWLIPLWESLWVSEKMDGCLTDMAVLYELFDILRVKFLINYLYSQCDSVLVRLCMCGVPYTVLLLWSACTCVWASVCMRGYWSKCWGYNMWVLMHEFNHLNGFEPQQRAVTDVSICLCAKSLLTLHLI